MRIIGLDLSLSCSGLARPNGTTLSFRPQAGPQQPERRLYELAERISSRIACHQPEAPDAVRAELCVLEDHGGGPGGRSTTLSLAELHGAIKVQLYALGLAVVLVNPMTLKAWAHEVIGRAVKSKDDMISAALTLGYRPENDNEADAALLHAVGLQRYHPNPDWPFLTVKLAGLAWPDDREVAHV